MDKPWAAPLLIFAIALPLFAGLFFQLPVLYDTDSYYHLAIARIYAHEGPIDQLPWARYSLMNEGFGDKEFLFHLLLAPFGRSPDPTQAARGGRWALALLNALLAALLAYLGVAALGRWGLVVPLWVYACSEDFLGRVIRLRPELLSLLLLLLAIHLAARKHDRLLGLVAALYTLSYTAFHALLGLCFAWFFVRGWTERRWSPSLLLYPLLGAGLGLLVHPNFPHNLAIWKVQSLDFFTRKAELNVGTEITPASTEELLLLNLGWILGLIVLWRSASPSTEPEQCAEQEPKVPAEVSMTWTSMAWTLHVATAAFGGLYFLAQRFSIYFIPLATLSLAYELRRRGWIVGRTTALPGRGRIPTAAAFALALAVGLSQTATLLHSLARAGSTASVAREVEWADFGRAVPAGARVAAEWGSTHLYMYWAPQALYLNVLDPVFMALPFPEAYNAARDLFTGREPDIPLTLESRLDSRFVALSIFHPRQDLLRRLEGDPRIAVRYKGYTALYEAIPGANQDFLLDWRIPSADMPVPAPSHIDISTFPAYPRSDRPEGRRMEGFIDTERLGSGQECIPLVHDMNLSERGVHQYELAAWGPATLWIDGFLVASTRATGRAMVGGGLRIPAPLTAGEHRFTVLTCPGRVENRAEKPRNGFYLRRLTEQSSARFSKLRQPNSQP